MSKKKFTDGLESLFGKTSEDPFQEDSPLLVTTGGEVEKKPARRPARKRSTGKSFTSDLDSLFEQVVREKVKEEVSPDERHSKTRKKRPKPVSGLDALIRRTSNFEPEAFESAIKKRVTFVFDKQKLIKLKKIAKTEKAYLQDIIGSVVSDYIEAYEA